MIKLLLLVIIDHIRSVPRKNTLNLMRVYYNIYMTLYNDLNYKYHVIDPNIMAKDLKHYNKSELVDIYHKMVLIIWKVYWMTPSMKFVNYEIDSHHSNDPNIIKPYLRYIRFDCMTYVYFFTSRELYSSSKYSLARSHESIEKLFLELKYPNSSVIFIKESKTLDEKDLQQSFPDYLFDTIELQKFREYHLKNSNVNNIFFKFNTYFIENSVNVFVSHLTFDWIYKCLFHKFRNHAFYMEKSEFEKFDKRINCSFTDPTEFNRWARMKQHITPFENNPENKYFPSISEYVNDRYKHIEQCVDNLGYCLCSTKNKKSYKSIIDQKAVPVPLIVFPTIGMLKGSKEYMHGYSQLPFYKKWLKLLIHNIKLIIFICFD
jgi:hypothetical protein